MSTPADGAGIVRRLELYGPAAALNITAATTGDPTLTRTIDGATTLTLDLLDGARTAVRSGQLEARSFVVFDGVHLELAGVRKSGDALTFTLEDGIVGALRRRVEPRSFPAETVTVQQIATELAGEAGVAIACDPAGREKVHDAVERNVVDPDAPATTGPPQDPETSWGILTQLAEDRGWRCLSDGTRLLFGSDAWLMNRLPAITITERTGGVHDIDWDLDVGKPVSSARVDVDVDTWSVPAGLPVDVRDQGPASGRWLVAQYERPVFLTRGTLSLTRPRASLAEPPPGNAEKSDEGEEDFLPDAAPLPLGATPRSISAVEHATGTQGNRAQMLRWAHDHSGTRYSWGKSGPDGVGYDCSGYVQEATRAGGKVLAKPAAQQWNTVRAKGRVLTVEEGLRTPGALLFRIQETARGGSTNHVAISTGDGYTLEARGQAYPNGRHPSGGRTWTHAGMWL